jgi:hypothetical protein
MFPVHRDAIFNQYYKLLVTLLHIKLYACGVAVQLPLILNPGTKQVGEVSFKDFSTITVEHHFILLS